MKIVLFHSYIPSSPQILLLRPSSHLHLVILPFSAHPLNSLHSSKPFTRSSPSSLFRHLPSPFPFLYTLSIISQTSHTGTTPSHLFTNSSPPSPQLFPHFPPLPIPFAAVYILSHSSSTPTLVSHSLLTHPPLLTLLSRSPHRCPA